MCAGGGQSLGGSSGGYFFVATVAASLGKQSPAQTPETACLHPHLASGFPAKRKRGGGECIPLYRARIEPRAGTGTRAHHGRYR